LLRAFARKGGPIVGIVFNILLVLIFIVLPVAALCMQTIPVRLDDVTFRDTRPDYAWVLVAQYAEGTFEQRFGYPTGYFYVDDKRSTQPTRVLLKEFQPSGAITDGCSAQLGSVSLSGFEGGCTAGCIGICLVALIGAPFFLVSILDRFFRLMLRSRVDVKLTVSGADTVASFAFYGPGGYSLRRRYAQVFEKPALPAILSDVTPTADGGRAEGATA
jgi:hypothetical protein